MDLCGVRSRASGPSCRPLQCYPYYYEYMIASDMPGSLNAHDEYFVAMLPLGTMNLTFRTPTLTHSKRGRARLWGTK